jgi:hypothetical protein
MDWDERKMCANKSWLGIAFAPSKLNYFDPSWLSSVQIFVERRQSAFGMGNPNRGHSLVVSPNALPYNSN